MGRKMVQGKVTYIDLGKDRKVLGLDMPRSPEEASMTFKLESIIEQMFMGQNITIIVNDEEGNPSFENNDISLISADELANNYGVV